MNAPARGRDAAIVIAVALAWTGVVIAFSTSMGARPLRLYDWGPPVFACVATLLCMLRDRGRPTP